VGFSGIYPLNRNKDKHKSYFFSKFAFKYENPMKKVNITTAVLLIYLIVMSIIGWPGKQADPDYVQYFGVIAATVLVIGLLRFLQIKRLKIREKMKDGKKE